MAEVQLLEGTFGIPEFTTVDPVEFGGSLPGSVAATGGATLAPSGIFGTIDDILRQTQAVAGTLVDTVESVNRVRRALGEDIGPVIRTPASQTQPVIVFPPVGRPPESAAQVAPVIIPLPGGRSLTLDPVTMLLIGGGLLVVVLIFSVGGGGSRRRS